MGNKCQAPAIVAGVHPRGALTGKSAARRADNRLALRINAGEMACICLTHDVEASVEGLYQRAIGRADPAELLVGAFLQCDFTHSRQADVHYGVTASAQGVAIDLRHELLGGGCRS